MAIYPDDSFTFNEVLQCLDQANLKYKVGKRYVLTQCPFHQEKNASAQIFLDDFFVLCHAGCGRQHITKAFPELRRQNTGSSSKYRNNGSKSNNGVQRDSEANKVTEHEYKTFNLMEYWHGLPLIPRDHKLKGLPLDVLDNLGWRWVEDKNAYFIPYFNSFKTTIPFAQYRYLDGDVRFKFLKDSKPTMYGTWNLEPDMKIFLVEGTSDCAVLEYCNVPWIGAPSAASGALVKQLMGWCMENNVELVYAGDKDLAGNKLLEAVDEVGPYRVHQVPSPYKDWGEFFEAKGQEVVINYCDKELNPTASLSAFEKILEIIPGAVELEVVSSDSSKEPLPEPIQVLF